MEVHPWSWVYFVSFVLIAAFIVINVLIGIVLNSMEEAREAERRQAVRDRLGVEGRPSDLVDVDAHAPVVERIALLRAALDELETELSTGASQADRPEDTLDVPAAGNGRGVAVRERRPAPARRSARGDGRGATATTSARRGRT